MIWDNYKRLSCFPQKCSCEPKHLDSIVIQPFATITSLPFIVLGIYFLKQKSNFHLKVLSSIFIILGFSSTFLHVSLLNVANYFDFGSIFAIFSWVISYLTTKKECHLKFILKILGLTLFSTSGLYFLPSHPAFIFAIYFLVLIFYLYKTFSKIELPKFQIERMIKAIAFVGIGGLCFIMDESRIYCFEHFFIYGHAIWHLFVVAAIYNQYLFFRDFSEDRHKKDSSNDHSSTDNQEADLFIPS